MLVIGASAGLAVLAGILIMHFASEHGIHVRGAVVAKDPDPSKELPLAGVEVSVAGGLPGSTVRTDESGYFSISIPFDRLVRLGLPLTMGFRHPDYEPFELGNVRGDKLYIVQLTPLPRRAQLPAQVREIRIGHIVASYSVNTTTAVNVGSAVKSFQILNTANVPCKGRAPCSPDGKWKAAVGSAVLDAGPGNEFRNPRASCIAGPCPFTRIDSNNFAKGQRTLRVTALDWSDTATFLLEAEVYKSLVNDVLRQSYPVTFAR